MKLIHRGTIGPDKKNKEQKVEHTHTKIENQTNKIETKYK